MGINIRQKGQEGEREVAKMLNEIVAQVRRDLGLHSLDTRDEYFQRNQNQSAVGGDDLSSPMPLAIEVKRQEQLSVNTWWNQCTASALRTNSIPILIFRQNRKKWRVVMNGDIRLNPPGAPHQWIEQVRVEVDLDTFKQWFYSFATIWVSTNVK